MADPMKFKDFNLAPEINKALDAAGFDVAFEIQEATIPSALKKNDLIAQAKTGTGKTLAFVIPVVQQVLENPSSSQPEAVVVVPTRELATQVGKDFDLVTKNTSLKTITIYGGTGYQDQIKELEKGVDIVVGTVGRIRDLQQQGYLNLQDVSVVVLDEADEMLQLGFIDDVEKILDSTDPGRQTMLFSATMPGPIMAIAKKHLKNPLNIRSMGADEGNITGNNIKQFIYRVHPMDKEEMLGRILQAGNMQRTIIFTQTKREADKVTAELKSRGFKVGAIHGDFNQKQREKTLDNFRKGKVNILVATDVAARGIDIDDVSHVINYRLPDDENIYVHRIGRTARAGSSGTAVTFVDWEDEPQWALFNKALKLETPEPVETYSTSAHLFDDLNIPKGTKGRLSEALASSDSSDRKNSSRTNTSGSRGQQRNRKREHVNRSSSAPRAQRNNRVRKRRVHASDK